MRRPCAASARSTSSCPARRRGAGLPRAHGRDPARARRTGIAVSATCSRVGFGALLVGYHDERGLRYAGKVGTGYDTATLRSLRERLDALAVDEPPFVDRVREASAHWVRPLLVAEVAFTEWTGDGPLRHPRFLGLRTDKAADDVVREVAPTG
jgi:ATP-dependent DNA ligase